MHTYILTKKMKEARKGKVFKCPYCDERDTVPNLILHVDEVHEDLIPKGQTPAQVVFNKINRVEGSTCLVCRKPVKWSEEKWRYESICSDKCHKEYVERFKKNMKAAGKENQMKDPDHQKKMLEGRTISGEYKFSDGGVRSYCASYEKETLNFLDTVCNVDSKDIFTPGPIIEYEWNGEKHFWITDIYHAPYNLIIECKDGGSNKNTHPARIEAEYRQQAKEKQIIKDGKYNYIRLTDKNFIQLLTIFKELKHNFKGDINTPVVKIFDSVEFKYLIPYSESGYMIDGYAASNDIMLEKLYIEENGKITIKDTSFLDDKYYSIYKANIFDKSKSTILEAFGLECEKDINYMEKIYDGKSGYDLIPIMMNESIKGLNESEIHAFVEESLINDSFLLKIEPDVRYKLDKKNKKIEEGDEKMLTNLNLSENDGVFITEMSDKNIEKAIKDGGFYGKHNIWNSLIKHQGKLLRVRVENIVLSDDGETVFLDKRDGSYRVPGGSTERYVEDIVQAANETKEEARINCKNIRDSGLTYIDIYDEKHKQNTLQWSGFMYDGSITKVFVSTYDGPYTGKVDKHDRDAKMTTRGAFYNLKQEYPKLRKEHRVAIERYLFEHKHIRINENALPENITISHDFKDISTIVNSFSKHDKSQILSSNRTDFIDSPHVIYRKIYMDNKTPMGFIELYRMKKDIPFATIVIGISPKYRKQGLSDIMVKEMKENVPGNDLYGLIWNCNAKNEPSNKLAKKHGFEFIKTKNNINNYYIFELKNNARNIKGFKKMIDEFEGKKIDLDQYDRVSHGYHVPAFDDLSDEELEKLINDVAIKIEKYAEYFDDKDKDKSNYALTKHMELKRGLTYAISERKYRRNVAKGRADASRVMYIPKNIFSSLFKEDTMLLESKQDGIVPDDRYLKNNKVRCVHYAEFDKFTDEQLTNMVKNMTTVIDHNEKKLKDKNEETVRIATSIIVQHEHAREMVKEEIKYRAAVKRGENIAKEIKQVPNNILRTITPKLLKNKLQFLKESFDHANFSSLVYISDEIIDSIDSKGDFSEYFHSTITDPDTKLEVVGMSPSVDKYLRRLFPEGIKEREKFILYVYEPKIFNDIKTRMPVLDECEHVEITDTVFVDSPVELRYVGSIQVIEPTGDLPFLINGSKGEEEAYYSWDWIWTHTPIETKDLKNITEDSSFETIRRANKSILSNLKR